MTNYSPITQTPIDVSALNDASLSLQGYDSTQSGNAQLRRFSLTGVVNKILGNATITALQSQLGIQAQYVAGAWNNLSAGNGDGLLLAGTGNDANAVFSSVVGGGSVGANSIITIPAPTTGISIWEVFYGSWGGITTSAVAGSRGSYVFIHLGQNINNAGWSIAASDGESYTGGANPGSAEVITRYAHGYRFFQLSPGNTYQHRIMISSNATGGSWVGTGMYIRARRLA